MSPKSALASAFSALLVVRGWHASAFAPTPSLQLLSAASSPAVAGGVTPLSALREATFGMGCFWEPSESLLKEPGVLATAVGYTGAPSNKKVPTYDSVCFGRDWVEAVRVAYDDDVVSYDELLDSFHRLQKPGYTRQYASVVFANDAAEAKEAERWRSDRGHDAVEIESASPFFRAEEYHQRYWEKQRGRLAVALALIAGESGIYDGLLDGAVGKVEVAGLSFDGICGALFFVGAAWVLVERLIARDVREMELGELMTAVAES